MARLTRVQLNYANRTKALLLGWPVIAKVAYVATTNRANEYIDVKVLTGSYDDRHVVERWRFTTIDDAGQCLKELCEVYGERFNLTGIAS